MTLTEFREKFEKFMDAYIKDDNKVVAELLKELNDYAVSTKLYKSNKDLANFNDYSFDDVFDHMCLKICSAPIFADFTAVLCIPFLYEKFKGETA